MKHFLCIFLASLSFSAWANNSIEGTWITVDDTTPNKEHKSWISISKNADGSYSGTVTKLLLKPGFICSECSGQRKDQPVENMTVLWGLKEQSDNSYSDGQILDPNNGKVYKAKAEVVDGGKHLKVRGFMGVSLLGRTQTWIRK